MIVERLGEEWTNATVLDGSVRPEDLLNNVKFIPQVDERFGEDIHFFLGHADPFLGVPDDMLDDFFELVYEVWDFLDEIAPEGCIFGVLEGDGACFGFWLVEEI